MPNVIVRAINKANEHLITVADNGTKKVREELRTELRALKKDELIERVLDLTYPLDQSNKGLIEKAAYAILEDDECRALDYGTISQLIRKAYPWAKTTAGSVGWYASEGINKNRDVKPRLSKEALQKLLIG